MQPLDLSAPAREQLAVARGGEAVAPLRLGGHQLLDHLLQVTECTAGEIAFVSLCTVGI